ncbi:MULTISPECIES: hypothetical protein [unclassified Desulfovibrio]|uniref:hypothetical protein n=1 Tax=unclassified Desulfovibrio TaxID=2593640 RepID=UPI002FD9D87F
MGTFKQKFDEQHEKYIQKLEEGISDPEIMREMSWSPQQLRRHQAQAFIDGYKRQDRGNQAVVALADMPDEVKALFKGAKEDALLKFDFAEGENNGGAIVTVI